MKKFVSILTLVVAISIFSNPFETAKLENLEKLNELNRAIALEIFKELDGESSLRFSKTFKRTEDVASLLISNELDLYVGLPKRSSKLRYSRYPVYALRHCLVHREGERIGKSLGVLKGSDEEDLSGRMRENWDVTVYEDESEMLRDFKEGRLDALLVDSPTGERILREIEGTRCEFIFGKSYRFVAYSRRFPERLMNEIDAIIKDLYKKGFFRKIIERLGLEKFVVPPNHLKFVNSEWPPYEYLENGVWKGIDVEILTEVLESLGYEVEIERCPWLRCLDMIRKREADGTFSVERTRDREEFMVFPDEPTSTGKDALFHLKNAEIDPHALWKYRCGYVPGYAYEEFLRRTRCKMVKVSTDVSGIVMLLRGRIDVFIADLMVGVYYSRKLKVLQSLSWIGPVREANLYVAFSKNDGLESLVEDFEKRLREFKRTKRYLEIVRSYGLFPLRGVKE